MKFNLEDYPLLKDLDGIKKNHHSILIYDNENYAKLVKYYFIQIGLEKGENSIILTHGDVNSIENEAKSFGIEVGKFKRKKLFHIHKIKNLTDNKKDIIQEYKNLIQQVTNGLNSPFRITGRIIPDVSTHLGIDAELKIECNIHSEFDNCDCSFLCTYAVNDVEIKKRSVWLSKLFESHHHLFYATDHENSVSFDPNLLKAFSD
ncbi:MAG: MEDS domain-containing protein [Nitrosopumilaceae archaeon]